MLALAVSAPAAEVPSPESVLGFRPGEDRKLADWSQIVDYFQKLAAASPRLRLEEIGKTTEGRPFVMATISSEANLARLDDLRRINARLYDPRGLGDDEARSLLAQGRTIVALNHGIHSTEVAATQTSMETAFQLARAEEPWVREVLDRVVVLILPSHNPDGTQRVTDWYRQSLGTPWEGGEPPFLYNRYVGHDNNRDWYMFTQQETRLTLLGLYDRWHPQIVHDLHQMGSSGARLFLPPYIDPWEPNVDPALRTAVTALGSQMAADLTAQGRPGVVFHALFDAWTPARAYPFTHGGVRVLSESASARLASPYEIDFDKLEPGLGYDARRSSWNFPLPWRGGTWRLRDIVDQQLAASRALLEHAARNRDFWLSTFLEVNRRACARREPSAFVVPAAQDDPWAAARLLAVLRTGGVEVHRAPHEFGAGSQSFGAGSHIVLMQQPASAFAKTLLERQSYPDLRQYPGGPPQAPYDVTAHTLPLLMGVRVQELSGSLPRDLEPVADPRLAPGQLEGRGPFYAIGHKTGELLALARLLAAGVPVRWSLEPFTEGNLSFGAGTLLVPASAKASLASQAREIGFVARAVRARPRALGLRRPRVGVYQSWVASMDEGWTRYVFDKEAGVAYQTLHDADVRAGGLERRFDVVILPDQSRASLLAGYASGRVPAEYVGGLGPEGVQGLKQFAEAGGTLIAFNEANDLLVEDFHPPVANALAHLKSEEFYCPGAILRVAADPTHPIAHGLDRSSVVWFETSPAFEISGGRAVLTYQEDDPLLSGWLLGGSRLKGRAALAEVPLGKGRLVLFGFRPQYRAQSWASYVPMLNAIYLSAATPAP